MHSDDEGIGFGGTTARYGLWVDKDLYRYEENRRLNPAQGQERRLRDLQQPLPRRIAGVRLQGGRVLGFGPGAADGRAGFIPRDKLVLVELERQEKKSKSVLDN